MKLRPVAGPSSAGCGVEGDAGAAQVGDEGAAEVVGLDLADIGAADAEGGDADDRVGRRTAGDDPRRDACGVERLGALLVDQRHRAFDHVLRLQIGVVGLGDDVDQRIAQAENVYAFDHDGEAPSRAARLLAPRGGEVKRRSRRPTGRFSAGRADAGARRARRRRRGRGRPPRSRARPSAGRVRAASAGRGGAARRFRETNPRRLEACGRPCR